MLVLTRKANERIVIGKDIEIFICSIGRDRVKVGINAPANVRIIRGELQSTNDLRSNRQQELLAAER